MEIESRLPETKAEIDVSGTRVILDWGGFYDPFAKDAAKRVPSATFKPADKSETGKAYWYFQLRLDYMRELRNQFGNKLTLGPRLRKWGREQVERERNLQAIQTALWADLPVLADGDKWYRKMFEALYVGPKGKDMTRSQYQEALRLPHGSYQTADVRFMVDCPNPMNGNQPGTGKTLETIATVFEAGLNEGPRLVIAQKSALDTVWMENLEQWQEQYVILARGDAAAKRKAIVEAYRLYRIGEPYWLVTNIETVRYNGIYTVHPETLKKTLVDVEWPFEEISQIHWDVVVVDEFHKLGLNNTDTLASKTMFDIKAFKKIDLSGTPMGGKPVKLFSVLHHLEPQEFSSKWGFINMWLETTPGERSVDVGGVKPDKEQAFSEMLSRYMVRRLKSEVLPWLPPKDHINIWATLEGKQLEQYTTFAEDAEIRIEEENLSAAGILAEYMRLKQFANCVQTLKRKKVYDPRLQCHVEKIIPYPTEDSCKLPHAMRILGELGIEKDEPSDEGAIIFSQFAKEVDMICGYIAKQGIKVDKLTGATKDADRTRVQNEFKNGDLQVLVMNTMAGGTSINALERANTVIFMDETWNPDDQEQAADRAHRGAKEDQVTVYTIRTKGTIEEYIHRMNIQKQDVNVKILDFRRKGLRAI